jgi:hypothetical protein
MYANSRLQSPLPMNVEPPKQTSMMVVWFTSINVLCVMCMIGLVWLNLNAVSNVKRIEEAAATVNREREDDTERFKLIEAARRRQLVQEADFLMYQHQNREKLKTIDAEVERILTKLRDHR